MTITTPADHVSHDGQGPPPDGRSLAYKASDRDRAKHTEYMRRYRAANKDRIAAQQAQYYRKHRDRILATKQRYYRKHRMCILAAKAKYRETHPERIAAAQRRYAATHPATKIRRAERCGILLRHVLPEAGDWIADYRTMSPLEELIAREEAGLL